MYLPVFAARVCTRNTSKTLKSLKKKFLSVNMRHKGKTRANLNSLGDIKQGRVAVSMNKYLIRRKME